MEVNAEEEGSGGKGGREGEIARIEREVQVEGDEGGEGLHLLSHVDGRRDGIAPRQHR